MEESLQIEPDKIAIGALLQAERGKQKLTRKQVAEQLNLSESMISALENDQEFDDISPTYVRGYRRAYVRLLGIDESEVLIEPINTGITEKPQADLHYFDKNLDLSKNRNGLSILTKLLAVAVLFAIAIFSWPQISTFLGFSDEGQATEIVSGSDVIQSQQGAVVFEANSESDNNAENAQGAVLEKTTSAGITTKIINLANDLDQSKQLDKSIDNTQVNANTPANNIESEITELLEPEEEVLPQTQSLSENSQDVELASVNQQETNATITFVSNGESWLSIEDAQNNNLYRSTLKLDRISVTGELPLNVSTGNVGVLRILGDLGKQRKVAIFNDSKRVAKFLVDVDVDGKLTFTPR